MEGWGGQGQEPGGKDKKNRKELGFKAEKLADSEGGGEMRRRKNPKCTRCSPVRLDRNKVPGRSRSKGTRV